MILDGAWKIMQEDKRVMGEFWKAVVPRLRNAAGEEIATHEPLAFRFDAGGYGLGESMGIHSKNQLELWSPLLVQQVPSLCSSLFVSHFENMPMCYLGYKLMKVFGYYQGYSNVIFALSSIQGQIESWLRKENPHIKQIDAFLNNRTHHDIHVFRDDCVPFHKGDFA